MNKLKHKILMLVIFLGMILAGFNLYNPSSIQVAKASTFNSIPSSTPIDGTDLNYRNGWFANTFSGRNGQAVVHSIDAIAVDPATGSVYTNTFWEEGGMHVSQYRDGEKYKHMNYTFGWGRSGGHAVAVNSKYVYAAVGIGGPDACATSTFLNDNGLPANRLCGTGWIGIMRYKNTTDKGDSYFASELAPFPTGYYETESLLLLDPVNLTTCPISGTLATETELFVTNYCQDKIQVYDAETMLLKREFSINNPGKMAMDKQGHLWIVEIEEDSNNYNNGDFKFTYNDVIKIVHYTTNGTKLPQELSGPEITNTRGIAVNSRDELLVAIGGEADRTNAKQQVYFYNNIQNTPTFYKAFGEEFGYNGGEVNGQVKDGKFDWITGLAVDAEDNIYLSMQKIGVASYKEDGTKNWEVLGMLFLDSTAPDPQNPNILYSKWDKFEFDPNRQEGQNWKHLARIYDFKKYPEDPRNWFNGGDFGPLPQKVCYVDDVKFLVMNSSTGIAGFRFNKAEAGEVAIPAFEIHPGDDWDARNFIWVDANGDGTKQSDEIQPNDIAFRELANYVDDDCGVWFSQNGTRAISIYNKFDETNYYDPQGLHPGGFAPDYKVSTKFVGVTPPETSCQPYYRQGGGEPCLTAVCPVGYVADGQQPCGSEPGNSTKGLMYDAKNNTMYIHGFNPRDLIRDTREHGNKLTKFVNWNTPNQSAEWVIDIPYDRAAGLFIGSMTMSGDYIMATSTFYPHNHYLIGKDTGEMKTLSTLVQGDFEIGIIDINRGGILVNQRPDGTYLASSEDDHFSKSFTTYIKPNSYNSVITGQFYLDSNRNSIQDPNETGENLPEGTKIKLTNSTNQSSVFYPIINTYGDYAQALPAGAYSVEYILPSGYTAVGPTVSTLQAPTDQINNTDSLSVGIQAVIDDGTSTLLSAGDIANINFNCETSNHNSVSRCNFTTPLNKSIPADFHISFGGLYGKYDQICSQAGNQVTCTNVKTPNSVGYMPISANLNGVEFNTGESVKVIGATFGSIEWVFTPSAGQAAPTFKSNDPVNIKATNFKSVFDTAGTQNSYICSLEYRNLNDKNSTQIPWNSVASSPIQYNATNGCEFNITKSMRGNTLNQSLRLKIIKSTNGVPSTKPEDIHTFYNEYIFRFQGAGVAVGA